MVTVVLPYVFGSMALAALGLICVYKFAFAPGVYRGAAQMWVTGILCVIYLPLSFFYGMFLAFLSTLRALAGVTEEAVADFILRLKKYTEHKVHSMKDGLPKEQAQILLNAGIKEVSAQYNAYRPAGIARALSAFLLSFIVYASRKVLLSKIRRGSGAEISLGLMFAGPQALAAAAVLNLKLTATIFLVLGWSFGLIILSGLMIFIIL
ncbi:MAG: hypothetical protein LBI01_05985 [Elusimicrobium sp.]|nr:hypothetical protein [Elusimicrobium sp.]